MLDFLISHTNIIKLFWPPIHIWLKDYVNANLPAKYDCMAPILHDFLIKKLDHGKHSLFSTGTTFKLMCMPPTLTGNEFLYFLVYEWGITKPHIKIC